MRRVILASTSPRRKALLESAGVSFEVMASEIDESWQLEELPNDYIIRMVAQKAQKVVQVHKITEEAIILTADTIGVLDGQVLTKPKDKQDALTMWQKLSGTTHEIWTAVCATLCQDNQVVSQKIIKVATNVTFVQLTHAQMERYWQTGEPSDKAGAYAIQGGAAAWVKSIHGSYTNVVGLPLAETLALLDDMQGISH